MSGADRIMSWGMPLLYLGPAFELPRHSKSVGCLCIGLDGLLTVLTNDGPRLSRSVYVEPGISHRLHFEGGRIACLYLDGAGTMTQAVVREMTSIGDGFHLDHRRTRAIAAALEDENPLSEENRERVAAAFGFARPGEDPPHDARVARAMASILADPADAHPVRSLARQAHLSDSRIRHAFRDSAGMPLRRFRVWARMGAGLRLIGQGANLTTAAHEAGFSSSAHFSTAYRAMFGIQPSAVVRAHPLLAGSTRG